MTIILVVIALVFVGVGLWKYFGRKQDVKTITSDAIKEADKEIARVKAAIEAANNTPKV